MILLFNFIAKSYTNRYLFIRQLHDRHEVLQARRAVLEYLHREQPNSFDSTQPLEEAVLNMGEATTRFINMEV